MRQASTTGEVADAPAGQGEGLGHRARDDEPSEAGQQGEGGVLGHLGELLVGLVDDDEAVDPLADLLDHLDRGERARRVVGRGDEQDVGPVLGDGRRDELGVEGVVLAARGGDVAGVRVARVLGVHRVGGSEAQHRAAGPAEGLEDVRHDLVGSVGDPDVRAVEPETEVGGQVGPQRQGLAVGVAVDRAGCPLDLPGHVGPRPRAGRVGVLVGVEAHRHVELGGAVGLRTDELGPQRQLGETDPRAWGPRGPAHEGTCSPVRTAMALAWPGRFSACAKRWTVSPRSARACDV